MAGWMELVFGKLYSTYPPTLFYVGIYVVSEIRVLFFGTLCQTLRLEKVHLGMLTIPSAST